MMMNHTRYLRKGTALIIALALLAAGCTKTEQASGTAGEKSRPEAQKSTEAGEAGGQTALPSPEGPDGEAELIAALKTKYEAGLIDYSGDTIQLDRDEAIQIKLGYNPYDGAMSIYDSFVIYQDPELKFPLDVASYDWDMDSGLLTIEPPLYGPAEYVIMDIDHPSPFLETNDESGWGNLPQLYLAAYADAETGSPIEGNPLVTVLKVNEAIKQAPQVKFSQDEYGSARFSWKETPGAEEYFVFRIKDFGNGLDGYMNVVAATTDTQWTAEQTLSMDDSSALAINGMFKGYVMTDEDWGELDSYAEYFGVIAVSADGCSHISNLFNSNDLAHLLPYSIAYSANDESEIYSCAGTGDLPAAMWIEMCDGSLSQRVLEYDKDSIEKVGDSYSIDGKAYGTPLATTFHVTDPDWGALDQELSALEERQDGLKNRGGNVEADISFITGEDEELPIPKESPEAEESLEAEESPEAEESLEAEEFPEEEAPDVKQSPDSGDGAGAGLPTKDEAGQAASRFTITANSALSEYLAIQMLNTEQEIDISAFPEAADTSLVVDAFLEAQYQNPLILGIKGAGMDTDNRILRVMYDYDAETTEAKRKEVEEKVTRITDEIIKDGMSELEKEIAINQYLCDNARYDDGALENAAEHNFQYVDESYNDSFTAYGVLVNQIGVCASYSAGFKLLADAAGLDSIVVTGYLEGNLPHAWNKVRLDGQWNIVDSTNNDNDMIQNALFNLSDSAAYSILAEDDRFALDGNVYDYEAPSDEKEYYRINDNYFSMDQITDILAEKLNSEGRAAVRTDYDLDDESFNRIAQETANQTHSRLTGFHWMGVIHLEQK